MPPDEDEIKALADRYEVLKQEHESLLNMLAELREEMDAIMLQIVDVTRK